MSILSKLTFTDAKRSSPATSTDPKQRLRSKLIAAIEGQMAQVDADIKGVSLNKTVKKYTGEGEDRQRVEVPARVRRWYFQSGGQWHTEIRYGTSIIPFGKHTTIGAGEDLESLNEVYGLVVEATEKGELDKQLAIAGVRRRKAGDATLAEIEEEEVVEEPEEPKVAPRFKKATPVYRARTSR